MRKRYKINSHNSTVCGYPGRDFDWNRFDWEGKSIYGSKIGGIEDMQAPLPWVDDGLIEEGNQYLHVPYDFEEHGTIYRVRPNPSMRAGSIYQGHLVLNQKAIKREDSWYWELKFGEIER